MDEISEGSDPDLDRLYRRAEACSRCTRAADPRYAPPWVWRRPTSNRCSADPRRELSERITAEIHLTCLSRQEAAQRAAEHCSTSWASRDGRIVRRGRRRLWGGQNREPTTTTLCTSLHYRPQDEGGSIPRKELMFMKTLAILVIASMSCVPATSALAIDRRRFSRRLRRPERHSRSAVEHLDGHVQRPNHRSARGVGHRDRLPCRRLPAHDDVLRHRGRDGCVHRLASRAAGRRCAQRSARANCASDLRLYDGISYGGSGPGTRHTAGHVINLAGLGFDNATTSYKIGACSAVFWDGVGAGAVYPGNTSASAQSPNMVTGWNNRISSVYIY